MVSEVRQQDRQVEWGGKRLVNGTEFGFLIESGVYEQTSSASGTGTGRIGILATIGIVYVTASRCDRCQNSRCSG